MTYNVIIAGCVKDCATYISSVFDNIEKIKNEMGDYFNIIKIICSYDHSNDKTFLELCKQKKHFSKEIENAKNATLLEFIVNNEPLTKYRTVNISNARNRILDYIETNNDSLVADYLIMMDFDDVGSKEISIDALKYAFDIRKTGQIDGNCDWDIATFMNERYYDYWALSLDDYVYSCWHNTIPQNVIKSMHEHLYKKIENQDFIECLSAFNGFGIFKIDKIRNIRYKSNVNVGMYYEIFQSNMKNIEDITNTNYKLNEPVILDCEHRYYQLLCRFKNNAKNVIINRNLFPKYDGHHADFLIKNN